MVYGVYPCIPPNTPLDTTASFLTTDEALTAGVPTDNTAATDEDPGVGVPTGNIIPTAGTDDDISASFSTDIIAALAGDEQADMNSNFMLFLQDVVPVLAALDSFDAVSSFTVLNACAADADESDPTLSRPAVT